MNREQVDGILNVVKSSTDKNVVCKCLIKLRTDLVKDRNGIELFRSAGGVGPMVRFLHKPHEKILELALSILANCCTDDLCCKEAFVHKVHLPLAVILKSIPNPVIQCRACRLLGNLAKNDSTQLSGMHSPIAHGLCKIIESTTDVQARIMAFRACRVLMPDAQFVKHFLQANGFYQLLRIFASVMKNDEVSSTTTKQPLSESEVGQATSSMLGLKKNQHREKYFEEVARNLEGVRSDIFDHEVLKNSVRISNAYVLPKESAALDLAYEILKCLLAISAMHIVFNVWESLTKQGGSFAPIVYFASEDNKQRTVVLKILSNFSKNQGAFYILSSADAIVAGCELLVAANMVKPLTESETRHCLNIICMLSTDACNRSKIRRSGALRKLIDVLRQSNSQSERSLILYILNNFQYDNMSMELMLREGLISLLIRELNDYLTSDNEHHKRKREERLERCKKRKISEVVNETVCKFPKTCDVPLVDFDSPSSSPRSYQSTTSPCSSRCMSPVGSSNLYQSDDGDDDNYSPACSDDESSDEDNTNSAKQQGSLDNANGEIMKLLDVATETIEDNISDREVDDENSQDVPHTKSVHLGNITRSTIDIIENLLLRVTLMINKRVELGKPETFDTLIKAVHIFGANNNFANSLTNILLESQFFAQIIRQGIVHQLYQLDELRNDGFGFLETLTNVGESNYGKAELVRLLRSGDDISQRRAAIAVAHIIRNHRLLYQFLNDGNALTLLFEMLLRNKIDEFSEEAADAISNMSRNTLGITMPVTEKDVAFVELTEMNTEKALHDNCNMRFVVTQAASCDKDATPIVIGFNKQLLCKTSEVFNTMMNSDFREGNEGEIQLQDYSADGLRYFLNLIERHTQNLKYNIPPARNYRALLEAFEMSRVYIIPDMEKLLQKLLVQFLDADNCLRLLEWALKNYHADLTETAINYYLCSQLSTESKVALFHEADYSTYSTEWFQLITDAIYDRARSGF